jgi:hypothetical protein
MLGGVKSFVGRVFIDRALMGRRVFLAAAIAGLILLGFGQVPALAQAQASRLILKDGSYQSITKYEIHGDRIRYFSAERGEWEEVPKALVDWDATDKFEHDRQERKLAPEAVELDKELEAERTAEQARSPQVAPGLRLPDQGGIFLLDTFENQPQLSELQQSGAELDKNDKNAKLNILRAVINPLSGAKQAIELPGAHARIQSHTTIPSLYIDIDSNTAATLAGKEVQSNDLSRKDLPNQDLPNQDRPNQDRPNQDQAGPATAQPAAGVPSPLSPSERFKIIRIEVKNGKRVAGAVKITLNAKTTTDERLVAVTSTTMAGGWIKLTPTEPLTAGEYAVAEMMGKEGMNIYVWDFGVNPSAPANLFTWKPEPTDAQPKGDQPADVQKREKQ